ncbi:Gustatory Receptor [Nesidiocoris tenuis]|uniref:Gustatory receptor n=1 Tax=Nesidiocoris tenuis TaxID=355587 RepID=A0ABN7B2Z3_9HEMI|nr:Gustatory Receptor [Nesidiocoris tenuis]
MRLRPSFVQRCLKEKVGPIHESDLYFLCRPILWTQLAFGRLPFHVKSGWMRHSFKSVQFLYVLCVYLVLVAMNVNQILEGENRRHWLNVRLSSSFQEILLGGLVSLQFPTLLVYVFMWLVGTRRLANLFNEIAVVEKKISDIFPNSKLTKRQKIAKACIALVYLSVISSAYAVMAYQQRRQPSIPHLILYGNNVFIITTNFMLCCTVFLHLRNLSAKLRNSTIEWLNIEGQSAFKIAVCRKLWILLRELSNASSSTLFFELFFGILTSTVLLIISSYGLIYSIRDGYSFIDIIQILPYFIVSVIHSMILLEATHQTKIELGDEFMRFLSHIDSLSMDVDTSVEVERFMRTISNLGASVSLQGYVTMDRGFQISILSFTATYLLVLLQFRASDQTGSSARSPSSTESIH